MLCDPGLWPRAKGARFITLEGVDGAGKTTQSAMLARALRGRGHEVVETREPGGAPGAEEIRALLLEGDGGRWSAMSEALLFTAARRDHVERMIGPALERGAVVICDRFVDSTRAYQSARGLSVDLIDRLHDLCVGLDPDMTLVLDVDPVEGLGRGAARGGGEARFESMGLSLQCGVRAAFRTIAQAEPGRCHVVDAAGTAEEVAARIRRVAL